MIPLTVDNKLGIFAIILTAGGIMVSGIVAIYKFGGWMRRNEENMTNVLDQSKSNHDAIETVKSKLTELEMQLVKVDTILQLQMQRAVEEGIKKGLLRRNSPVVITDLARAEYAPYKNDLLDFWHKTGVKCKNDADLFISISQTFGQRMAGDICKKLDLTELSCITAAMMYMKELAGVHQTIEQQGCQLVSVTKPN